MTGDADTTILKKIASLVEDECLIVTYKTLSRRLDLPINKAKTLLADYLTLSRQRKTSTLSVLYSLSGTITLPDGSSEEQVHIVKESDVPFYTAKMRRPTQQVYSIQTRHIEDSVSLYLADNPVSIEDARSMRAETRIQCPYVLPREKSLPSLPTSSVEGPLLTGKDLKKLEGDTQKLMASVGMSVEALRVTPSVSATEEGAKGAVKPAVASWVKAAGLDPKKSQGMKKLFEQKRKTATVPKQEAPVEGEEEDEEDFFAAKKSKGSAAKAKARVMVSDDEDDVVGGGGGGGGVGMEVDEDVEMAAGGGNETMKFGEMSTEEQQRSPSPELPVVIRRRAVASPVREESASSSRKKVATTFNDLSNVSSDEADADDAPPPKKTPSTQRGKGQTKRALLESDSDDAEQPTAKPTKEKGKGKVKGKWGFSADEEAEGAAATATSSTKRKSGKGPVKVESDAENDETAPVKAVKKPRKRVKKSEVEEDQGDQGDQPLHSPQKGHSPELLRQFLTPTVVPSSGKRRKQVMRITKDEEGYEVTEKVWVDVESDDEDEKATGTTTTTTTTGSTTVTPGGTTAASGSDAAVGKEATPSGSGSSSKLPGVVPVGKKGQKKTSATNVTVKGKGVQSSIMSFFKKT